MLLSFIEALMSGEDIGLFMIVELCALVFLIVCCFPIHESAHAWMAEKLGDRTGRLSGRITLSPLAHLDIFGTLMMLVFGFGYAKPVPVNINNFPAKKRKLYFALTALAGPVSNIILALIFSLLEGASALIMAKTASSSVALSVSLMFFQYASYINVSLAVFNLIPIPPLDGSRILTSVLPDRIYYKLLAYERYSMYILFAFIFIFHRIGFSPIALLSGWLSALIETIGYLPFRFFM